MSRFRLLAPDASRAPCPIPTFWQKFNHGGCSLYFPVYCYLYSSHLIIRWAPFHAVLPFQQPYILWEPLFTCPESTLIHFVTHLANSLSYGTIKVYLATVNKLHIEFGCPLELSSMSLLFKTLCGIKRSLGISGAIAPSHHSFNPPPNISCPTTFSVHGHGFLHAAFTVALFGILRSSEFTCSGTFDTRIHLIRSDVFFYPDLLRPDYFEEIVNSLKRALSGRQPSTL